MRYLLTKAGRFHLRLKVGLSAEALLCLNALNYFSPQRHGDHRGTIFFVCRETTTNKNHQSRFQREFLAEGLSYFMENRYLPILHKNSFSAHSAPLTSEASGW